MSFTIWNPIYGIVLAALIFGSTEQMSLGFHAGAAIIVGSVLALPWLKSKPVPLT